MSVYTISPSTPFLDALASSLFEKTKTSPETLSNYRILLPTRRACRSLRDSFLRLSEGKPTLLPIMQPIGDIDEEELDLQISGYGLSKIMADLPPVLSPLRRQLLLAKTIQAMPAYKEQPDQAIALAKALGQLMDQIYTENLSFSALADLVPEEFATHWQITLEFLKILTQSWPEILKEEGVIEAADYRNKLIIKLADFWEKEPPAYPVIAAGSTGSIPSTSKLLSVISKMPNGTLILPGLDKSMDKESWNALDDTHPQATLKNLLSSIGLNREDVKDWIHVHSCSKKNLSKAHLISEVMRPAQTTELWKNLSKAPIENLDDTLSKVHLLSCKTQKEEALSIALILREALELENKRATLVTPDRNLARHVTSACKRWGILLDDSGGKLLSETRTGVWFRLTLNAMFHDPFSIPFLDMVKNPFFGLCIKSERFRNIINSYEARVIRDPNSRIYPQGDPSLSTEKHIDRDTGAFLVQIDTLLKPYKNFFCKTERFENFLDKHIEMSERFSSDPERTGQETMWSGEDGEALSLFLSELREHTDTLGEMPPQDYADIIEQLLKTVTVRPKYGTHPRLSILGQLESRLVHADIIILSGLNEGSWPPDPGADPWMSRPMRKQFGLPSPERSVGLSAHDFAQSFCADTIYLTRSEHVAGSPTVPSRWLLRMDTVLQAQGKSLKTLENTNHLNWARLMDQSPTPAKPYERPAPTPPIEKRPKALYVTNVEQWMRDPYALYAKKILGLKKLKTLAEEEGPAERGTLIHSILEEFIKQHKKELPQNALSTLLTLGKEKLEEQILSEKQRAFWWPRLERALKWFLKHEIEWRAQGYKPEAVEIKGKNTFQTSGASASFTLKARMDRLDLDENGYAALIDYKTGTPPQKNDIQHGLSPQIPLTALLIKEGATLDISTSTNVTYLGHWTITGANDPGKEHKIGTTYDKIDIQTLIDETKEGFLRLIEIFDSEATPYFSMPDPDAAPNKAYRDYDHLARFAEWENESEVS